MYMQCKERTMSTAPEVRTHTCHAVTQHCAAVYWRLQATMCYALQCHTACSAWRQTHEPLTAVPRGVLASVSFGPA